MTLSSLLMVLGLLVLVAAPASAQPPASARASLSPIEGGYWEASYDSSPVQDRVCLEPDNLYVVAVRIEPDYWGSFAMARVGAQRFAFMGSVDPDDGSRWVWDSLKVLGDPQCFEVVAGVRHELSAVARRDAEQRTQRRLLHRAVALRAQIYRVRVDVEW